MGGVSVLAALCLVAASAEARGGRGAGGHSGGHHSGGSQFHGGRPIVAGAVFVGVPAYYYGTRYYAPAPAYYYPPPPVVGLPPDADLNRFWYYCPAYRAYYPQVQGCPGGWQMIAPQATSPYAPY